MLHRFRELIEERDREHHLSKRWAPGAFVLVPLANDVNAWLVAIYESAWEQAQRHQTDVEEGDWRWN